ncbi:uncharacterized protein LOC134237384 [Saccostrea cucullata]|uniref:uncharacterized protein LOC134237384 n=1 Tax=Saccostrea cuccullata TaxID=36930 RepID=UPI002ED315E2
MSSYMQIERVVPRLGMVYGVLMQGRNKELSLVQRMMSLLLFDNICDQKVFDRLQPVGVCIGYERSLKVIQNFGGKYKEQLIEEIQNNKTIRIVGDNINWTVGVHDQRQDNRGHMQHAFGSAAIVQNISFDHLSNIYPQRDFCSTPVQAFLPSPEDNEVLTRDYTIISARVMLKHLPYFRQFRDIVPTYISQPTYPELQQKSKVIPLPVLYKNEQSYKDVVDILEFYEDLVLDVCRKCNKDENDFFIHVGGDQLTRERFSGAKAMRAHEDERKDRFENISPITFELFHMQMNFLKMAFKILYKENSVGDRGTLSHLKNIISRTNVNENINTHYDADKDFFVSVVDMYIVECVLEYFGKPDVNSAPSKHILPEFADDEIKRCWFFNEVGTMLKNEIKTMNMGEQEVEGQVNGHIPADRRMEYLVKQIKEHIKHMFSNKTERNVRNRSSAISSIREIAEHYDEISGVVERSKRHSDKSAVGDELSILNELREVRPFSFEEGRQHEQFSDIQASSSTNINVTNYHRWIENKKLQFSVEYGN